MSTARYGGPDEPGHILRAASVARGQLIGAFVPGLAPGYRAVTVPAALATGDPACFRHAGAQPATCAHAAPGATGLRTVASAEGSPPPLYYAIVGLAVRAIGDPSSVLWYRLVAAGLAALALATALIRAARLGRGSAALIVVAALSPAAWFLLGVVNPNSLEIALALVSWVGLERVRHAVGAGCRASIGDLAWMSMPVSLAVAMRPISAMEVVAMAGAGVLMWRSLGVQRTGRGFRRAAIMVVPPAVATASVLWWNRWADVIIRDPGAVRASMSRVLTYDLGHLPRTAREISGSLGWLEFSAPTLAQIMWWLLVLAAGVIAWRAGGFVRAGWLIVATVALVLPVAFDLWFVRSIGFIWQGRYSLPTAVGLVLVGIGGYRVAEWSPVLVARLTRVVFALAALAEVSTLWATLRRYAVGTNGSWWFTGAVWHPQLPPFVLIAVNAALMLAIGVCAATLDGSVPDEWGRDGSVLSGRDLAAHNVEGAASTEPLDLLGAERVDTFEVDG